MNALLKLILAGVGGVVLTLILFGVVIYPNLNQVNTLYSQSVQKQTDLETLSEQILAYKNSQSDLNAIQDKNQVLTRILPRDNLQTAIAEIESAAAASSVKESLTIQEQFDDKGNPMAPKPILKNEILASEVVYTMSITGQFASVLEFIQYMEHLPNFTEISGMAINSTTANTDTSGVAIHNDDITAQIQGIFIVQKGAQ